MTLEALASAVGVSYQQIQKYEYGVNRISIRMLLDIAKALGTSPEALLPSTANGSRTAAAGQIAVLELLGTPEAVRLHKAFALLGDPRQRVLLVDVVEYLSRRMREVG